jgi:uncharacterized protein (TIGR00661 family)
MKRILVTPLDWGLGHATRCIPVIRLAIHRGHTVLIASSGNALELLRAEFPSLQFFELPAYAPAYSRRNSMVLKMGLQLPKFIQAIAAEHTEIENIITENKIDLVISDNRYGCWSGKIPSVFITHQSNILMPKRFGWLSRWVRTANESAMNKYPYCWIPDYPQEHSLAGELVSFGRLKYRGQIDFIGALSRFKARKDAVRYDVVGICSGPEPQRSLLEELLLTQLKDSTLKFVIVRGVMVKSDPVRVGDSGEMTNFLTSDQLQELLPQAKYVVARSGYSTIMDMKALQSNVIFIPTPGQTEQEYLAHRLKEKGIAFFMKQHEFDVRRALQEAEKYTGFTADNQDDSYLATAFSKLESQLS